MQLSIQLLLLFFLSTTIVVGQKTVAPTENRLPSKIEEYLLKSDACKVNFEYSNAFNYITEVLNYAKEEQQINTEALCYIKLTELYRHATLFERSSRYLEKSEDFIRENSSSISPANFMLFYNRKAALFSEYYLNPDSTLFYSKKALHLAHTLNNKRIEFASLMEIGLVYENQLNYEKALGFYAKSLEIAKADAQKLEICNALVNSARLYEKMNQPEMSLKKCDEGLANLGNENFFQKILFYDIKQSIYDKIGNKTAALENLKERLKYTQLYYDKNAQDQLLEANKRYELLEKDKEIDQGKQDILQAKREQLLLMFIILFFVLGIVGLLYYSRKIKKTNKQLTFYSNENNFLLKETNHRINNNLQLIIVLMHEELDKLETSDSGKFSIKKILAKVDSIATLHRHLYQSTNKETVDLKEYLTAIVDNFNELFSEKEITIRYTITTLNLPIDLVMYLGLLTTELFTNSLKHAFGNQEEKNIQLRIYRSHHLLKLEYRDNGKETIGKIITPNLVVVMCHQIKANYTITTKSGFEISIEKELNK